MIIRKRLLLVVLTFSILCSMLVFPVSAAQRELKTGVGFVTASSLRMRSQPTTASATLALASRNEVVVILGKTGSWYRVMYNLQEGYMHADYLKVSTVKDSELGYGKVNYTAVNMRTGPSTGYRAVGQSHKDDLCYIIGLNKQWFKVIWNGQICYIRSDYLDLSTVPFENRANPKSPLFFRGGKSTGTPVSVVTFQNSVNYIASSKPTTEAAAIIATAKQYIGVPYLWGGTTPKGFDCSGFTQYVFRQHGIHLGRNCESQYAAGTPVSKKDLQPGDLVFFQNTYQPGLSHVGIYVGDNSFIHASSSRGIMISSLDNVYWAPKYLAARRVL